MRKFLWVLTAILLFGNTAQAATTYVTNAADLKMAIGNQPASNDITLSNGFPLTPADSNIEISKDVTIRGAGYIVNGSGLAMFRVTQSARVTFDNLKFQDAGAGAVSVGGTSNVTFAACTFTGNSTTGNGGAVNITGGTVAFTGTTDFLTNRATGSGGAVYISSGAVNFPSSVSFGMTNTAANGGAVAVAGTASATFNSNLFTGNTANQGGALHVAATASVTFNGTSSFQGNHAIGAPGNGGAVYFDGPGSVTGGTFNGNTATGSGAGVYVSGTANISGGTFSANIASVSGGAVYATGTSSVTGGTFTGNTASVSGGAVYSGGTLNVSGGTFSGNEAVNSGGALYSAAAARITAGTFSDNKTTGLGVNYGGGAIWANSIEIMPSAVSMTFERNTTAADGGALFSMSSITASNTIFSANKAVNGGAASSHQGLTTFDNCVLEDNLASNSGGGANAGTLDAKRTTFRNNNTAVGFGGAVYLGAGAGNSSIVSCLFETNRAKQNGGALFLTGNQHVLKVTTSVFNSNYANLNQGGAASIAGSDVLFNRCTFTGNVVESGASAQGGAVYVNTPIFKFVNCTFHKNEAGNGRGGALSLGSASGSTADSTIFFCTFVENLAGGGRGGALYTEAIRVNLVGSAYVGNIATHGEDIFGGNSASGSINSRGYNILGNYGMMGISGPSGNVDWAAALNVTGQNGTLDSFGPKYTKNVLFGSNFPAANPPGGGTPVSVGSSHRSTQTLNSIALAPTTVSSTNPALDSIPNKAIQNLYSSFFGGFEYVDARGEPRPVPHPDGNCDVGAYESGDGSTPPKPGQNVIAYVKMSGIPNTLKKIGQTVTMTATVYYRNGSSSSAEAVTWVSSNPNVARIDSYGRLVALQQGKTTISVATQRLDAENQHATDSAVLEVTDEMSYTNVHPDVWQKLGVFNTALQKNGQQLFFLDADPSVVKRASFQSAFQSAYGGTPSQITELLNASGLVFDSKPSYTGSSWVSARPSVAVSLSSASQADLLPLEFTFSLTWDEVSKLLGRTVTRIDNDTELFGRLKLLFQAAAGTTHPVVDADGEYGVAVAQAISSGALVKTNGNNGLTLTLNAFLSNVAGEKPRLIDNRLVVPDGAADGMVSGSMWLLKRAGGTTNPSEGGSGGGGCNSSFGILALALVVSWGLRRQGR